MKILFADSGMGGHHEIYLENLAESNKYESIACLSDHSEIINHAKQFKIDYNPSQNVFDYINWLKSLRRVADQEQVELIQLMAMDSMMKYFGSFLNILGNRKVVIVYHHFWPGFLRKVSYRLISRKVDYQIVHTDENYKKIKAYGINNICRINYPSFGKQLGFQKWHKPIRLLAFGATRYDKGLDYLLNALKSVKYDFHLTIAGSEGYFDKNFIQQSIASYKDKVDLILRFLPDEEKEKLFSDTDIVVLPYRREFDGASGPLTEGAVKEKMIVGPNHGSLGQIIKENHLGLTFESENTQSLVDALNKALSMKEFRYDEKALEFKHNLDPVMMRKAYEDVYSMLLKSGE